MKFRRLGAVAVLMAAVGAGLWLTNVQLDGYRASSYTANVGELVDGVIVGQTLVGERDNLAGVAVMFATYSGRARTGQVRLTVRRWDEVGVVLREAQVQAGDLGDNQLHRFSFPPVEQAKGETFVVLIESPDGKQGAAVTVDVDNRDPYHQGSAYILRGVTGAVTEEELAWGGKARMDLAFSVSYQVPFYQAAWSKGYETIRNLKNTWPEARSRYGLWARVAMQSMLLVGISLAVAVSWHGGRSASERKQRVAGWLAILLALAVVGRIIYAVELPLTNDEGNYLYDARTLLKGKLAGGDGYVKAPLVVLWVALWEVIAGQTIIAGRLSSIVIGALTLGPIYIIGRELWDRKIGVTAAAVWALLGITVVFNIYVHTQPLAIFFATSGIAAMLIGTRHKRLASTNMDRKEAKIGTVWLVAAGVLLGLGVISRKSVLATGLVPLLIGLVGVKTWRQKWRSLIAVGAGFMAVLAVFIGVAVLMYGQEGGWEAVGYNSAEDGITAVEEAEREQVRAYSIRGMTPFFREALPLIMLSVLGWGLVGEWLVTSLFGKLRWIRKQPAWWQQMGQKAAWLGPVAVYSWAWSFFKEYEGSSIMVLGMEWVWWAMLIVVVLMAAWPSSIKWKTSEKSAAGDILMAKVDTGTILEAEREEKAAREDNISSGELSRLNTRLNLMRWLLPIGWVGGLVFFYQNWIKFHANYIGEFLPPLVLVAGVAVPELWRRLAMGRASRHRVIDKASKTIAAMMVLVVLIWSSLAANYVTYVHEHTGTFQLDSLREAAVWARDNIPSHEPIFTGAAAVPYLSGHSVSLDIAHPRWYAYEFTRTDKERLGAFLPTVDEMLQGYRDAKWFLLDQQTGFSFLMEYQEIEAGLERDWQRAQGIENGSNTLTFYRRK